MRRQFIFFQCAKSLAVTRFIHAGRRAWNEISGTVFQHRVAPGSSANLMFPALKKGFQVLTEAIQARTQSDSE